MNKVVLITGSTSGIGFECAKVFAKHNYDVIINYNKSEREALELRNKLESEYNVKCLAIECNVSNLEEVNYMFKEIEIVYGKIDVIVNNAGIALDNLFDLKTVYEFRQVLDTNLIGPFLISQKGIKLMKKGSIINIASTDGIDTSYIEGIDYASSKAGLISLTKTLAKELSPKIRVNCVAPGWVNTKMNDNLSDSFRKKETKKILLKRFGKPNEIANVVYFLASEEASYINGSVIRVDGGY